MKKIIGIVVLVTVTTMLMGCFSMSFAKTQSSEMIAASDGTNEEEIYNSAFAETKRKRLKKLCETYTPENSVLVYGSCNTFKQGILGIIPPEIARYIQIDTTKPAQHLEYIGKNYFFFKPTVPGGKYRLYFQRIFMSRYRIDYIINGIQGFGTHPYDFTAPKKPGIYYVGDFEDLFSGDERYICRTYENDEGIRETYGEKWKIPDLRVCEQKALEYALKYYKDTAWESLLSARLSEVQNAK